VPGDGDDVSYEPDGHEADGHGPEPAEARMARLRETAVRSLRAVDRTPMLVRAVQRLREKLPGDPSFGDPLSIADRKHLVIAERRLTELTHDEPGVVREIGLGALQVWQAMLEARGKDQGDLVVTIAFTDLVGFSSWALQAGDDEALLLLRQVGVAVERPITQHGGQIVKRLGDGTMSVFLDPMAALEAMEDACDRLGEIEVDGYQPQLRMSLHTGCPRRLGGDYLGVDVNIAARLMEKAAPGEILVSEATLDLLDREQVHARRKKTFALLRVKGVPDELDVYAVRLRDSAAG
jgi:adenylate cyclase